jgi:hypothetical protein
MDRDYDSLHPHWPDNFFGREIPVLIPRATECRLKALAFRSAQTDPDARETQEAETEDETLSIMIGACIDRGLYESERDDGIFFHGGQMKFTDPPKIPWRLRLKLAWRELRR